MSRISIETFIMTSTSLTTVRGQPRQSVTEYKYLFICYFHVDHTPSPEVLYSAFVWNCFNYWPPFIGLVVQWKHKSTLRKTPTTASTLQGIDLSSLADADASAALSKAGKMIRSQASTFYCFARCWLQAAGISTQPFRKTNGTKQNFIPQVVKSLNKHLDVTF